MRTLLCVLALALLSSAASADQMTYDRPFLELGHVSLVGVDTQVRLYTQIPNPVGCLEHWRGTTEVLLILGDTDGVPRLDTIDARAWVLTESGCLELQRTFTGTLGEGLLGAGVGFAFQDDGGDPLEAIVILLDGELTLFRI